MKILDYNMENLMTGLKYLDLPNVINPFLFDEIFGKSIKNLEKKLYSHNQNISKNTEHIYGIIDLCKNILLNYANEISFNENVWDMDLIRYNLSGEKDLDSGLCWHNENINYKYNVISVLIYLRKDKTIKDGNLRYKTLEKEKKTINLNINEDNCIILIMDGNVYHKPEKCSGFGKRELINVSFEKY